MVRAHSRACALSVMPGKQPPQLERGRQLAALFEDGADRSGFGLADDEHRWSMRTAAKADKQRAELSYADRAVAWS